MTGELTWAERTTVQRFGIAATLTGAISVVTLVPTLLAVLAPLITEDLGLTRSGFGVLATGVFIGGGATSVWAGRIVDRLGGRSSLILLYLLASITVAGVAVAPTYAWLLVAVTLSGLPGALSNPVTNQVISAVVPSGRRGLLIGFKQSGAQIAQVAGGLVLPALAIGAGWRGAALVLASLPLIGVVATRRLVPARSGAAVVLVPGHLELRGPIVYLTAYALLMSLGAAAVLTYLPLFAYDALGFSLPASGVIASAGAGAGFLARVLWARAVELWISPSVGLLIIAVGSVTSAAALVAAPATPSLVWLGAVAFGATGGAWSSVAMVALLDEVEPAYAGRASGVVLLGFYGGFIAGPILFGVTADRTGAYGVGWSLVGIVFLGAFGVAAAWHRERRRSAVSS